MNAFAFLSGLLRLSLLGSLLAALLLLLRPLLRGRVSHTLLYALWLLVLLRLCLPVGITLSLPSGSVQGQTQAEVHFTPSGALPKETPAPLPPSGEEKSTPPAPAPPPEQKPAPALVELLNSPGFWTVLWGVGAFLSMGWYSAGYLSFIKKMRKTMAAPSPAAQVLLRELEPAGRVQLWESPLAVSPLLMGPVKPVILLPPGLTDEGQLRDILAHELTHARRHDLLYKWLVAAVSSLHWFNPLMLLVRRETGRLCELSCDEAATAGMDAAGRRHYGETLLALAAAPASRGLLAVTLCEEKDRLRERLEAIALPRRKGAVSMVLSGLLAVLVCGCALISGAQSSVPDLPHTPNSPPVSLVFREFLQGERTVLYSKEHAYNQRATIQQVPALFSPDSEYAAVWRFAVVDLNRDGEEEMILQVIDAAGDLGGYLILHRQGGELYGFFHHYQAFEELKTDGTFFLSSINGRSWAISGPMDIHVEDTGRGYSIPVVASQEQHPETGAEIFYVGGYRVSKETYNQVLENQRQKEDVPWYDFTLEGIAQAFPEEDPFTLPEGTENLGAIAAALEADFVDYWNTFVSGSMVLPKVTVLQSDRFAGMDRAVFLVYPDYNNTHTVAYSVTGDTVRRLGAFPSGLEFAFSAEEGGLLRTTWTQESPGGGAERFYYYYRPLPEGGVEWTEVLKAWADSEGVIQSAAGWQTEDQSLTKPLTPEEFEARLAAADEDFREAETISFGTVKNLAESGFDLSAPLGEESQPGSWRDFLARAMPSSGSQAAAPPPALEGVSRQEADFLTPEQWALFDRAEVYGGYFAFAPGRFAGEEPSLTGSGGQREIGGQTYRRYTGGVYSGWEDFYRDMRSVFTEDFFQELNQATLRTGEPPLPIYTQAEGQLYYLDISGGGNLTYLPELDRYQLLSAGEGRVELERIAYYCRPEELSRNAYPPSPATSRRCPVVLEETPEGWRVARFTLPARQS